MSGGGGPAATSRPPPEERAVEVRTGAWYGDRPLRLAFPSSWKVVVAGERDLGTPLGTEELRARLRDPIGSRPLAELARGRRRAAIIIDDISRPTPTSDLLPLVLDELEDGGLPPSRVRIVIAGGGHEEACREENLAKVGTRTAEQVTFEVHDPDGDVVSGGTSPSGIPLLINRSVMEADLKIGVGSIVPHEAAGFSGGSKILVPGVAATKTARYLHDLLKGAPDRGREVDNEFRRELDAIAAHLGLDFIVNVVLDHRRRMVDLFAGHHVAAHREGARVAADKYAVTPVWDADVVVTNTYPFDASLWFVAWGFWPLTTAPQDATKVVLADGSRGMGSHRLKPTELTFLQRAWTRLLTIRPRFAWRQFRHLAFSLRRTRRRQTLDFLLLCPNITGEQLAERYSDAVLFHTWAGLLQRLREKHGDGPVKVAVYPCAPLQVPTETQGSP